MSFTKQVITGASAEGDYIYYNATVINSTQTTTANLQDPEIYFQDTRQNPLIKDASKYVVSVDNFTLNGGQKSLPIFIPQIEVGTDVNKTIYTISMGYTNGTNRYLVTVPITWIPENQQEWLTVPTTATPRQVESEYYYCYTYTHWCNLMNNALNTAWRLLYTKVTADMVDMGTKCPFFEFNENTGLFSLCQDANSSWIPFGTTPTLPSSQVFDAKKGISEPYQQYTPFGAATGATLGTPYTTGEFTFVGWNTNLESLIANFDTVYYGDETLWANPGYFYTQPTSVIVPPNTAVWTTGPVYFPENIVNVIPQTNVNNGVFVLSAPYAATTNPTIYYLRETQDYISTGTLWSPVASLVLVTSTIPVKFEGAAAPVQLGAGNLGGATASSGAAQKVLLETPINAVTADLWRGFIEYKPLVPLFSTLDPVHDGITNLDVKLCWRNRFTNELVPLRAPNSSNFNFRLRFVRK